MAFFHPNMSETLLTGMLSSTHAYDPCLVLKDPINAVKLYIVDVFGVSEQV